ncbi:MAG: GGDEF domain-containing protein [Deltaproteobacteria bacterium]|nr:GGDEF domain-containing protein [Deltaproteobacteria bacterium]
MFAAIFCAALSASAETLLLEDKPSYDLSGYMEILTDPENKLTVQQAADRSDWTGTVRDRVPNLGFTQAAIWIRFSLANRADAARKFYISFEYPVTNSVAFYAKSPQGALQKEHTGSSIPASANVVPDRYFLFPLTMGAGETAVGYLKVQSTSRMIFPIRVLSDQALFRKAIRDYTVYGALLGFLVLVMLYFTASGSFLHKGTAVCLVLYSIFFGMHTAIRGGFIRLLLPDILVGIMDILQLVVVAGLFFTGAKFFRLFLSLKSRSKFLDRIMTFFQYLSLTFIVIPIFPDPIIIATTLVLIVINPLFSIGLAFYFWRKGVSNAGIFAIGWVVAHLVAVHDFFRINGVISYEPLGEWPIPFSLFIALLFLSIALIRKNAADRLMAETDPLTRLANRRKFDEVLHQEWDRCRRQQSPLSIIMADVDHFKQYNDSFGHRAGDKCLCLVADVLANHARRSGDLAVRYGGEEFVLLLPHLNAAGAFAAAERIRNAVIQATEGGTNRHAEDHITISLGVATKIPEEGRNPEDLVLEADKAMYEAKRAGRNRTAAFDQNVLPGRGAYEEALATK